MYSILRLIHGYGHVLLVSPAKAGLDTPGAKFFRFASWSINEQPPNTLHEISVDEARRCFIGIPKGVMQEVTSHQMEFNSQEEALRFILERKEEALAS